MHYALILAALLGQAQPVAAPRAPMGLSSSDVLAPIHVIPTRTVRKNIVSTELGWNSLTGLGLVYSRNLNPHIALDSGLGFSFRGMQAGVRGRYNLLQNNVTPFVGLGVSYATGVKGDAQIKDATRNVDYIATLGQSVLAQGALGLAWQTRHGLSMMGMVGYNQLLNGPNFTVKSGRIPRDDENLLKALFDGGTVVAMNIGYAF